MDEPQPESNDSDITDFSDETVESETDWESLIDSMGSCHLAEKREIIEDIQKIQEILLSFDVIPETENLRKLFTESIVLMISCNGDSVLQSCNTFTTEIKSKFSTNKLKIFLNNLGVHKSRFPCEEKKFLLPHQLSTLEDNHVYMASINNFHFFVFCIHNNRVYVFQSFIGKYLPKLFIFEKDIFLNSLNDLFFENAFIRNSGTEKPLYSFPIFSNAFVFLTGVFYDSDPQVDIFIKGSKPSDLKILSTVVLKFLDISDNIQTLGEPEPEPESPSGGKRKSRKKKRSRKTKKRKKSRKR